MTDQANTTVSDERLAAMLADAQSEAARTCRDETVYDFSPSELVAALTELSARRATADVTEAQLKVAREALKPFADKSQAFDDAADKMGFARAFDEYQPKTNFTHGDLRKALAALSQQASE